MATNMDINENDKSTVPVFEFKLNMSELDTAVAVGDNGYVIIPVNVLDISKGEVTLRKNGPVKTMDFKEETVDSMRSRMGTVEDEEIPFKEDEEEEDEE